MVKRAINLLKKQQKTFWSDDTSKTEVEWIFSLMQKYKHVITEDKADNDIEKKSEKSSDEDDNDQDEDDEDDDNDSSKYKENLPLKRIRRKKVNTTEQT